MRGVDELARENPNARADAAVVKTLSARAAELPVRPAPSEQFVAMSMLHPDDARTPSDENASSVVGLVGGN